MRKHNLQPKISSLLISLLAPFSIAIAQDVPSIFSPQSQATQGSANLQYTGANSRIGLGYQHGGSWRAEIFDVISETVDSAWLADAWIADSVGGLKLSYHLQSGATVNKYFAGIDQNKARDRKISLGIGRENNAFFGNGYLSYSPNGRRQLGADSVSTELTQIRGSESTRDYLDNISTTTTTRMFERAYEYGVGARVGRYYEEQGLRFTAGLDYEWGVVSAKQWGVSMIAEKFFVGTPHSIALQGDSHRKSGSLDIERNDNRFMLMYRYSFGGDSSKPAKQYRNVAQDTVLTTPVVIPARKEIRLVKTSVSMNGDAFFQLSSAKLSDAAKIELDRLAEILLNSPHEGNVRIVGHTCDLGSIKLNQRLSLERASAVRDYFLLKGVLKADEIVVDGKGKSEPKFPPLAATREKNRRVDLEFISVKEKEEIIQIPEQIQITSDPIVTYKRELIEQEPSWLRRALRTPAEHKRTIDTYRTQQKIQSATTTRTWVNRAPQARDDIYHVASGSTANFAVLSNDTDSDAGDILSLVSVGTASQGMVRVDGSQIVFSAPANFNGQASFSYVVSDNHGVTSTANVLVNIVAPNHAPTATDDRFVVSGVLESELDVLANDADSDGDILTIVSMTQPAGNNGMVSLVGNKIKFLPKNRFAWDSFTYTVSDGKGGVSTATVLLIDP